MLIMKIVKILPIVLVLFGKVFGQTEFCNLYRFINYEIVEWSDIESIHDDLFTNLYQNQLSLVDVNQDFINNDNFIINVFDITKKCTKKIECSFNFVEKQKFDWKKISGFSRDSKRIILAFYKDLCVFEKSKNDDYIFVKHYRLNHATDDLFITFDNDSLYYGSYNLLGNCISVIDLNTGINNTIIEPALGLNLLANLRPNKYCDMTNDFLAITKATDYEIEIFDKRNKLFQRI